MTKTIAVTIRNNKTQEEIFFVVPNNEQTKLATSVYLGKQCPKKAIVPKLLAYVATDKVLTPMQTLHAFGWSAAFTNQSKSFQKKNKIVTVGWTFHNDEKSLANFMNQYQSTHSDAGAEKMFSTF